jgi:hypothetical protein
MVALMAGIAIMLILSTVAVRHGRTSRAEADMMFRAQDIVRALKRFQADKASCPPSWGADRAGQGTVLPAPPLERSAGQGGQWQLVHDPGGAVRSDHARRADGGPHRRDWRNRRQPTRARTPPGPVSALASASAEGTTDLTGMPIAGVRRCTDRPFRIYKDKTEYTDGPFRSSTCLQARAEAAESAESAKPTVALTATSRASPRVTSRVRRWAA